MPSYLESFEVYENKKYLTIVAADVSKERDESKFEVIIE